VAFVEVSGGRKHQVFEACKIILLKRPRWCYACHVKALAAAIKSPTKRRAAKWIPGTGGDAAISKTQAERFTDGLLKIAARIEGLPSDLARNHDHYLHGLLRK
jgi:hypothetical protein